MENFSVAITPPNPEAKSRNIGGILSVQFPACIVFYNKYKNSVDLFDKFMRDYEIKTQRKKWYWNLFTNVNLEKLYHILDLGDMDLLLFRMCEIVNLVSASSSAPLLKPRPKRKYDLFPEARKGMRQIVRNESGKTKTL